MHRALLWLHRYYGGVIDDPIHKSHMGYFVGDYACARQFQYVRNDPDATLRESTMSASLGTAGHDVIAQCLTGALDTIEVPAALASMLPSADPADVADYAAMVAGLIADLPRFVRRVVGVEQGFISRFGAYWIAGHVDLIYEPMAWPGTLAMCDWKFGAQKPHPIELDHGWEAGLYGAAMKYGVFADPLGRDRYALERDLIAAAQSAGPAAATPTYGQFPTEIYQVHVADYLPYKRGGDKQVTRIEDLRRFGYVEPTKHRYAAGQVRGGAWMPVAMGEGYLSRLQSRLRTVVGTVRMGRFIDNPGEKCRRCHYATACLNAGYAAAESDQDRAALALLEARAKQGKTQSL
jgi:hypothetical protein